MFNLAEGGSCTCRRSLPRRSKNKASCRANVSSYVNRESPWADGCSIEWRVRTKGTGRGPPRIAARIRSAEVGRSRRFQQRLSLFHTNGNAAAAAPREVNGNGGAPLLKMAGSVLTPTTKLEHALKTAISAACNAEKFGAGAGLCCPLRFRRDQVHGDHGADQHEREGRAMTSCSELPELAEVLSPSQVRCFMDCQVRWWFKYGLKLPDPQTGNLALGKAVHAALTENFAQKLETREDLPITGRSGAVSRGLGR